VKKIEDELISGDLLMGANAISKFLGVSSRQVYRLTYDRIIPHFKLGGTVAARKSSLVKWMNEAEKSA
jgi:predicted DNA-binding transcriptional regulator AlpA